MPKASHLFIINILLLCFILNFSNTACAAASSLAKISSIRISVNDNKVRVVADADKEVDYESFGLSSPDRIVIDLKGAWLDSSVKKEYAVNNKSIANIRVAQFSHDTVRIVVGTSLKRNNYDVFSISSGNIPYRVVMDFGNLSSKPAVPAKAAVIPQQSPSSAAATTTAAAASAATPAVTTKPTAIVYNTSPGIKGKKIAIDPGHGGNDSGAVGYMKAMEKDTTLRIALKLKKLLENAGATVIMTRTTDTSVASPNASDVDELQARCDAANKANADIFISIHNDSYTDSSADGTSTYYYEKDNGTSARLANCLRQGIIAAVNTTDRGTKSCNFYVVKHTNMPASLAEVAFISNPADAQLLTSDSGTDKFAAGLYNGINNFFSGT